MRPIRLLALALIFSLLSPALPVLADTSPYLAANPAEDQRILHVLHRLGYGPRPGDLEKVRRVGVERYIAQQLHPESIPENPALIAKLRRFTALGMSPVELARQYSPIPARQGGKKPTEAELKQARQRAKSVHKQAIDARLMRAVESERQLQEVMTEFWFNHFNVYDKKGLDIIWVGAYEEQAIRPHALGKFRDLLGATAHHPAMLFYLDNWQNTKPDARGKGRFGGLNENYARELLELHTLGVDGGYTQQDVVALAKILTGWGIPNRGAIRKDPGIMANSSGFYFDANRHDYSTKQLLGQTITGTGQREGETALDLLARHSSTARHISRKLAVYFVSDNPPQALVDRLSRRFTETDGDIRAVLDTLFRSPEFWAESNRHSKFKDPYRYIVSMMRASGDTMGDATPAYLMLVQLGMPLYGCETPNGYKYTQEAWLSPDAMAKRLSIATGYASGRMPTGGTQRGRTVSAQQVANAIGNDFSLQSLQAIQAAPGALQAALILGSPEFMRY